MQDKEHLILPNSRELLQIVREYIHPRKNANESGSCIFIGEGGGKSFVRWEHHVEGGHHFRINLLFNKNVNVAKVRVPGVRAESVLKYKVDSEQIIDLHVIVYEFFDPRWPIAMSEANLLHNIIAALGEMEHMSCGWLKSLGKAEKTPQDYQDEFEEMLTEIHELEVIDRTTMALFMGGIHSALGQDFKPSFVHGDFAHHNYVVREEGGVVLFDLENACIGCALEDVSRFLNEFMYIDWPIYDMVEKLYSYKGNQLTAFRVYKAMFLVRHYARRYQEKKDDLSKARLDFWLDLSLRLVETGQGFEEEEAFSRRRAIADLENL